MKILTKIQKRVAERPAELAKLRSQGKTVIGWSGYNIPEELIYALGLIPVRVAVGGDEKLVELGQRYVSSRNCVYIRELLGYIAENKDPLIQQIDAYAFDATCLQTFRAAELVEYYFNKDVFVLGVPRNFYWKEAQDYFVKETEYFVSLLEEKYGTKLDLQKLKETISLYNRIREKIIELYTIQIDSAVVSWVDVYNIIQAGYTLDKAEYLELLEQAVEEADAYPREKDDNDVPRIFLSGSILPPGDSKLIDIITNLGGRIVGDDLWSGILPYLDLDIKEATTGGVALGYLNRTPHGALPYLELESDRRIKKLRELVGLSRANGVVYHTLRYCDPYSFKSLETKHILVKEGIQFLEIHTEYASSDTESIHTRIEAFLEMIENNVLTKEVV
ncbi:MAG: 2-hydroxyacyl-CoA dehydratase family protein [Treponema sp.]|jgi:benzoyl-CoA reductase/2-hydroxyglutaryl-CoA dehydratase subunit BcrC/BadD/HgdB|nr:2-hydroxyacyl-CoA dehydratase family protein [Treponema sp.]